MLSHISQVLNKKKCPHFRPLPVQMQRMTPLPSSPSCHQITTHLNKIQPRRKAERGGGGGQERLQSHLLSAQLGNGICDALLLLCQSNVKLSAAREGKGGEKRTLREARCCYRKNRYQIKKVCLKTVHMPAPGDFKYLWFATFLIFKSSRDAVCRMWCEHIPCLTWLWLVNCCSSGKGKAGSHKGFSGSPCCRPDGFFPCTLEAKSEICPYLLTLALFLPLAIPSQATCAVPSKALSLQAERCKGDPVRGDHLRPTATAPRCVIPPLPQMTKESPHSTAWPK